MKRFGTIAAWLAGGLALNAAVSAQELSATNNLLPGDPYSPIAVRNVFGLLPPPDPNKLLEDEKNKNLPKIIPSGLMSVFGSWKVLFKVTGVANGPGGKPGDKYYNLAEGQGQDEIEVTHIDAQNNIVTFNNHGTEQEIPLVSPTATGENTPSSPGGGGPGAVPTISPVNSSAPGPGGIVHFSGRGPAGGPRGMGMGNNGFNGGFNGAGGAGNGVSLNFGASSANNNYVTPQFQDKSTPEERVILMEAQRMQWQQEQSQNPALNPSLIPPTPLTKYNTPDGGEEPPAP